MNELLPQSILKKVNLTLDNVEQRKEILDIWFDSGLSWSNVLKNEQIADFYLEGIDQFTGWFQSSLLISTALRDKLPYKNLYVHGFAVDDKGLKMSKSLGNVIDPQEIILGSKKKKPLGVDTLRWWVAFHANQDSIAHVSENVLKGSADEVQKLRSTLRFALGSLFDYKDVEFTYDDILLIDKYLLHLLYEYKSQVSFIYHLSFFSI